MSRHGKIGGRWALSALLAGLSLLLAAPAGALAASVSGTVTAGDTGEPLADVRVGIGPVGYGLRDYTVTDADGEYRFDGLEAGNFGIAFFPAAGTNYLADTSRYFGGLTLAADEDRTGVDAALQPGATISGRVSNRHGAAVPSACVSAWVGSGGGFRRAADATTGASGEYTLLGLPAGSIRVWAGPVSAPEGHCTGGAELPGLTAQWFSGKPTLTAADPIELTSGEHRGGIDFRLEPAGGTAEGCTVPELRGRTLHAAAKLLRRANCKLGRVSKSHSSTVPRRRVIASTPSSGESLPAGTRVAVVVSARWPSRDRR